MHTHITTIHSNPNVGLYGFANDNFCLLGQEVPDEELEAIQKVLKVPCHKITIAGTSLIGVFVAGNNKKILIPSITYEDEIQKLKDLKIPFEIIDTKLTALGNLIVVNDKAALISTEFSEEQREIIENKLEVKTKRGTIADLSTVGSLTILSNNNLITTQEITNDEVKVIEKLFKIEVCQGSVNMGNNYVRSGVINNANGFIIGNMSSGPEITNIDEELGFLGK